MTFSKSLFIFVCACCFILGAVSASAATYYVSNTGSDTNDGLSEATAWQTLSKVNQANLVAGDQVLLKKGDTFYGSLIVNYESGTAGNPIVFGSYGADSNKPIITGFTKVTNWTNLGGNIWESTDPVSTLDTLNMVTVNGVNTAMGRYPNSSYLNFQSHSGQTAITSSSLDSQVTNWTGAEAVIRSRDWTLERKVIASQAGSTLNFNKLIYEPINGFGFFIQNDPRTLDSQNEWYFDPTTKKIKVYSVGQPSNVQVATVDTLVTLHGSYVNFENLAFTGANMYAFENDGQFQNDLIQNVDISFSGINAIYFAGISNLKILNNTISDSNNSGINVYYQNPGTIISNNYIYNTGLLRGMGYKGGDTYAIYSDNNNGIDIEHNRIIDSGYIGINSGPGDISTIKNNYVDTFATILNDAGGIYAYTIPNNPPANRGQIINNIVLNGIGAADGTTVDPWVFGIYLDDYASNFEVAGNTSAHSVAGIMIHNGYNLNIHDNTFYDNTYQINTQSDQNGHPIVNSNFNNNIYLAKNASQLVGRFMSTNSVSDWGTLDNNYYARPIKDDKIFTLTPDWNTYTDYTLDEWKAAWNQDLHSKDSPVTINDPDELRFEYNDSDNPKVIALGSTSYIDVKNNKYKNSLTLAPWSSVVLIKDITPIDSTAPTISMIISTPTQSSATITWSTDEASDSQVQYGPDTSYGATSALDNTLSTSHSVSLSDLSPDTTYHYQALSKDASGNLVTSTDQTFITTAVTSSTGNTSSGSTGSGASGGSVIGGGDSITVSTPIYTTNSVSTSVVTTDTRGCTASTKYSPINGAPCPTPAIPAGCLITTKYSPLNGQSCPNYSAPQLHTPSSFVFSQNLHLGVRDPEVKLLQQYLNASGFVIKDKGVGSPSQESDYFGAWTKDALSHFQAAHNITPSSGYFGPKTREFINNGIINTDLSVNTPTITTKTVTVIAVNLNVRATPINGTVLGVVPTGTTGTILAAQPSWLKVRFSNGLEGWVYERYTRSSLPK